MVLSAETRSSIIIAVIFTHTPPKKDNQQSEIILVKTVTGYPPQSRNILSLLSLHSLTNTLFIVNTEFGSCPCYNFLLFIVDFCVVLFVH